MCLFFFVLAVVLRDLHSFPTRRSSDLRKEWLYRMTPAPKISVIVPVYNVAPYVGECLSSLVHQTFTDFEIIAVNDGSTDGSLAVLREFERSYPMVHVIDQPNSGVS